MREVLFVVLFTIGLVSFAYRYVRWFVPGYTEPIVPLHTGQAVVTVISIFINYTVFGLELYVATIFVLAAVLGVVHDMSSGKAIGYMLQPDVIPVSALIDVTVNTALIVRSESMLVMIGNIVVLAICIGLIGVYTNYAVRTAPSTFKNLL